MKVINLLSHSITDTTTGISYPPSGIVVRANSIGHNLTGYKDLNVTSYEI